MVRIFTGFRHEDMGFFDTITEAYEGYLEKYDRDEIALSLTRSYAIMAGAHLAMEMFAHDISVGGVRVKDEVDK